MSLPTYYLPPSGTGILCLRCGRMSFNPHDRAHCWCGACGPHEGVGADALPHVGETVAGGLVRGYEANGNLHLAATDTIRDDVLDN